MKKPQMTLFKFKALDFIEKNAIYEAAYTFKNATFEVTSERPIIILCIGSDKNISDVFGPMVGTFLIENNFPYKVYGTLQNPVNAFNLEDTFNKIINHYENPFIIGIDASLGEPAKIGYIQLYDGPIHPGSAIGNELPLVGNMHIKGFVNTSVPTYPAHFLNDTRLFHVMNMSRATAHLLITWSQLNSPLRQNI
ncbi:putative sporulation protein YyaC [Psychrobacillus sp. OK028]|uniref:spore protease YyaC n=1 Tax=Psychrobacillus sp. OK028 TaxID=1884359 RepID=UPI0008806ACA|nr:spore protease YyaC [Psychrobacillus sp. OK028]SDN59871.1 putative sporulation protein YyaC [Psychrobacillus sp. OK028]